MKRAVLALILAFCLLLGGCGTLLGGEFHWEQTHQIQTVPDSPENISAENYAQLYRALEDAIENGTTQLTVSVELYDRDLLDTDVSRAIEAVQSENPVAAYAVQQISFERGTGGGEAVLVLQIAYLHDQNEIKRIQTVRSNEEATQAVYDALDACDSGIVLRVREYEDADFVQIVEDYAMAHPETVMETPQITANVYPQEGQDRVLELRFIYQTSRETLRSMQNQVGTLFEASLDMISVTQDPGAKYSQLYSLLMERFSIYTFEASITPAYSVFAHGVGDSKAFATVYAAMCRQAGLECQTVVGSLSGQAWYWNIISFDGYYYHVDLLRCQLSGDFTLMSDSIIDEGYVWDFSAHPPCEYREEAPPEVDEEAQK